MFRKNLTNKFVLLLIVILLLLTTKLLYIGILKYFKFLNCNKIQKPNVKIETIHEKSIIKTIDVPARIIATDQIKIVARISGYLEKSYFKQGDFVKKGDLLFLIEPFEYQNNYNIAKSNIQDIKARLYYANKQAIRAEELIKNDYISKAQYDEIISNRDSLKAQLTSAFASFSDSNRKLSYTKVYAPIDGRVGFIDISVGNYVTENSGNLTTLYSQDPIYAEFSIKMDDYNLLRSIDKGYSSHKVELYYQDGEKYPITGFQDLMDNKIDERSDTIKLRAVFKNPNNQLIHGAFMNAKLYYNVMVNYPVVPVSSVLTNQEGKYIYKLDSKNLPVLSYIKTSGEIDNYWIVTSGVNLGDKVIVEGIQNVIPGTEVNIIK